MLFSYHGKIVSALSRRTAIAKIVGATGETSSADNFDDLRAVSKLLVKRLDKGLSYLRPFVSDVDYTHTSYSNLASFDVEICVTDLEDRKGVPSVYYPTLKKAADADEASLEDFYVNFKFNLDVDNREVKVTVESELVDKSVVSTVVDRDVNPHVKTVVNLDAAGTTEMAVESIYSAFDSYLENSSFMKEVLH